MARYTIELNEIDDVFNFDYPFYDESMKKDFEHKFLTFYSFHEIGFETPFRFKKMLERHLLIYHDKYKQLYETQLKSKNIEFLLNKDLKETFIRENNILSVSSLNRDSDNNQSSNENSVSHGTMINTNRDSANNRESVLDTPMNSQSNIDNNYLSGVRNTDNKSDSTTNNSSNVEMNNNINNNSVAHETISQSNDNDQRERTELISQGNIGTTSSAKLLEEWRNVLINLDKIIIDDCRKLFMLVY